MPRGGVKTPPYILNLIGGEDVGADSISAREGSRYHKHTRANHVRPYKKHKTQYKCKGVPS